MVVYGVMTNESIAAINIAGVIPGLVLALLFSGYIVLKTKTMKDYTPAVEPVSTLWEKVWASRRLVPVFVLLFLVIGSMFAGYATATESAAVGVAGSFVLAWMQGTLNWKSFSESLMSATLASAMIALILASASGLSLAMGFLGLPEALAAWVGSLHLSAFWLIMCLLVMYTILGCFLDGISCVALTIAIIEPMVRQAGIDMIWFGIFVVLVVEMAQITPPVGFNLFVIQGMTGKQLPWIARTALPAFLLMMAAVGLLYAFPAIITWLPQHMVG